MKYETLPTDTKSLRKYAVQIVFILDSSDWKFGRPGMYEASRPCYIESLDGSKIKVNHFLLDAIECSFEIQLEDESWISKSLK